jgi:hypothetical protein
MMMTYYRKLAAKNLLDSRQQFSIFDTGGGIWQKIIAKPLHAALRAHTQNLTHCSFGAAHHPHTPTSLHSIVQAPQPPR